MALKEVEIKDVFDVVSGSTPSTSVDQYWSSGKIKWITPKDLSGLESPFIENTERMITEAGLESCSAKLIPANSIIVSSRAPIGYVAILNDVMACNQGCKALIAKNGNIDSLFIYYLLNSKVEEMNRLGSGSTFKEISKSKLESIKIKVPDLKTQQSIAFNLQCASAALQKRREALRLTEQFLQSAFLEMFGDPVGNERGWETDSLENMVLFKGGGTPSKSKPEYYHGTIPWVSPKDMKSLLIYSALDKITQEAIEESATNLIPRNSVLVVVRSGILKNALPIAVNMVDVAINQDMKALICSKDLDPIFLLFQLRECSRVILQSVRATTADNISVDVLKHLVIILPPIELQREFSKLFSDVEKLQLKQRISEIELEKLFQSLMQRYFG